MNIQFNKQIINIPKLSAEITAVTNKYLYLTQKGDVLTITFSGLLTQGEIDSVSGVVNNFVEVSLVDNLEKYMSSKVEPFVKYIQNYMKAENLAMGITQAGKTYDVLAFINDQVQLPNKTRKVSIGNTLDSGSLTVTIELLNYYIANPSLYEDLAPFVTVDRLTEWKTKILAFLAEPMV